MPTYREIQNHTKATYGFVPKPCWIAHILSDNHLTNRVAFNRLSVEHRSNPCPDIKRPTLEAAMAQLGVRIAR